MQKKNNPKFKKQTKQNYVFSCYLKKTPWGRHLRSLKGEGVQKVRCHHGKCSVSGHHLLYLWKWRHRDQGLRCSSYLVGWVVWRGQVFRHSDSKPFRVISYSLSFLTSLPFTELWDLFIWVHRFPWIYGAFLLWLSSNISLWYKEWEQFWRDTS